MNATLTDRELMQELRVSEATFYRMKKRGDLKKFALAQPIGPMKWSGLKVAQWQAGESTVSFGAGARVLRRA